MKSLLGLVQSAPCRIDLEFKDADGKPHRQVTTIKTKKEDTEEVPVYSNKDSVLGEIRLTPLTTKKLEHQGIKIQLVGQIELAGERGVAHEFVSLVRELAPPGELNATKLCPFEFKNVELSYDSYKGQQVRCRYLLRATVTGKGITPDSRRDFSIWVTNYEEGTEAAAPIKMEVGIEDCLHIEFEYDKARYHLQDVVVGRIYFLLVRIKLKHMEVEIRRKETTGAGSGAHSESETLAKYEIMDGAPVRGESVPIRLYLAPYDLAPTYRDVHNKFSVRYFLNLVLVDEEDRRYFKQQEITLYRRSPASLAAEAGQGGPPKLSSPSRPIPASRTVSVNGGGPGTTAGGASSSGAADTAVPTRPVSGAGGAASVPVTTAPPLPTSAPPGGPGSSRADSPALPLAGPGTQQSPLSSPVVPVDVPEPAPPLPTQPPLPINGDAAVTASTDASSVATGADGGLTFGDTEAAGANGDVDKSSTPL